MFNKFVAAATAAAFLSSAAVAGTRPGDALPSVQSQPAADGVQLAQNDESQTQGASQASVPANGRAEPQTKKKKRRFFGLPLWGLGALAASGAGVATLSNGRNSISP